jgi:hypothetical protein
VEPENQKKLENTKKNKKNNISRGPGALAGSGNPGPPEIFVFLCFSAFFGFSEFFLVFGPTNRICSWRRPMNRFCSWSFPTNRFCSWSFPHEQIPFVEPENQKKLEKNKKKQKNNISGGPGALAGSGNPGSPEIFCFCFFPFFWFFRAFFGFWFHE